MSESPTRRLAGSSTAPAAEAAAPSGDEGRHRGINIKPRHSPLPSQPPRRSQLLRRLIAVALAFATVFAFIEARSSPPSPPLPRLPSHSAAKNDVFVSPLPESAVAAAAKAASEITATTQAAFGLPGAASLSSVGRGGGASATSKLPLPSVGLPNPPRADKHPSDDEHAGETQQSFFDRVLLDSVEAIDVDGALFSSVPPAPALAARAVKAATAHAWAGYVSNAWGEDELAPLSKEGYETFCSLAVTMVDSLDTLLLLGMEKEFQRSRDWLLENLPGRLRSGGKNPCAVSVFEATIRVVGGLAAAADLSGDGGGGGGGGCAGFDAAAVANSTEAQCSSLGDLTALVAEALLPAFNVETAAPGSPSRPLLLPVSEVDLGSGAPLASADASAFGAESGASGTALLAEAGSLAPEFWRAGYWSAASELKIKKNGKEEKKSGIALAAAGASAVDAILSANNPFSSESTPLPATTLLLGDATPAWSERHTVGGRADSYYEYLLKMWLMLQRAAAAETEDEEGAARAATPGERRNSSSLAPGFVRDREAELEALSYISSSPFPVSFPEEEEEKHHHHGYNRHRRRERVPPMTPLARRAELYRRAWLSAVDEVLAKLVRETPGGSRYLTSDMGEPVMEHLACFFPGNLALGVMSGAVSGGRRRSGEVDLDDGSLEKEKTYLAAADALAETCALAGETTATGLAPEVVLFLPEARPGHPFSVLRPEAVESFFYLWRATKDPKWRQHGWNTFIALERHAKVAGGGYSGIRDVTVVPAMKDDSQPSWLLAETFKYLFLLFSEESALDLDEFVLNTEAHPLRVFGEKREKKGGEVEFQGQRRRPQQQESKSSSSSSSPSSSRRHLKP